jgi:hypothetical protein
MDIAIIAFLAFMVIPSVYVTLYIRRVIRLRQEAAREHQRRLEAQARKQQTLRGNPNAVTRRAP